MATRFVAAVITLALLIIVSSLGKPPPPPQCKILLFRRKTRCRLYLQKKNRGPEHSNGSSNEAWILILSSLTLQLEKMRLQGLLWYVMQFFSLNFWESVTIYLSNQYPWSIHCRRTSMGGWAPYFSLAGIFKSSTKTTTFLPIAGPYTPRFRLKKGIGQRLFNLSRDRGSPSYYKTREQLLIFLPSLLAVQNARFSVRVKIWDESRRSLRGSSIYIPITSSHCSGSHTFMRQRNTQAETLKITAHSQAILRGYLPPEGLGG